MNRFPSNIRTDQLCEEILQSKEIPWKVDGTTVLMGNRASGGLPTNLITICWDAMQEIEKFTGKKSRHIMVNRLPAGVHVPVHTDTVIDTPDRWHLPLKTDVRHCYFWDEEEGFTFMPIGYWYNVNYRIKHSIGNFGSNERIHLIVDLT